MALCISGTLAMHIFVPALPIAARDLGVSGGTVQLTLTLYLVGVAGGQLFWGPLSDRIGRRPALLAGIALYTVGSLASAAAPGVGSLVAARVVQAIGGCSGLVLGRAVLRDISSAREAAASLALMNLFMSVGPAMAPLVGGLGATYFGWRFIFIFLAGLGALTLFSTFRHLRETHTHRAAARGVMAGYFRLLAMPGFRRLMLGGACSTTSFYAFLAAAPFIFADRLHRPSAEIGFYFVVPILGFSIGAIIANRLVRRIAPTRIMLAASLLSTFGAVLFGVLEVTDHLSVIAVLVPILIFCIGSGTVSPLALTSAISVHPGMIGAASGLYGCAQMGYGALCTLAVSFWHANPAEGAAAVLVFSTIAGLVGIIRGTRG